MHRHARTAATMLPLTAFAFTTNCFPPLVTTIAERFSLPIQTFGWLFTLQHTLFASTAFVIVWIQRRIPIRRGSFIVIGLGALSSVFLFAPLFRTRGELWVMTGLLGVAGGLVESHGSAEVSKLDPRRPGQYLSLSQAFLVSAESSRRMPYRFSSGMSSARNRCSCFLASPSWGSRSCSRSQAMPRSNRA